jgi:hypothetical protein
MTPEEIKLEKSSLLAEMLIAIIDENKLVQDSNEAEVWKLGYAEAVEFMIEKIDSLR